MTISYAEHMRVQSRHLIADVSNPLAWLRGAFTNMSHAFSNGDMVGIMSAAFSHGATHMLEDVKARCPVDDGELRDSLYVTTEDHTSATKLSVQNTFAYITTDAPHAYFVEYGTIHQAAQPFMRPAIDTGIGSVVVMIGDIVVTSLMTGFVGRLAIDLADVGLAHSGRGKKYQKHSLARDAAETVLWNVTGHLGGKVLGGAGRTARAAGRRVVRGGKAVAKGTAKAGLAAGRKAGRGAKKVVKGVRKTKFTGAKRTPIRRKRKKRGGNG